jgi:hypothetical protein
MLPCSKVYRRLIVRDNITHIQVVKYKNSHGNADARSADVHARPVQVHMAGALPTWVHKKCAGPPDSL